MESQTALKILVEHQAIGVLLEILWYKQLILVIDTCEDLAVEWTDLRYLLTASDASSTRTPDSWDWRHKKIKLLTIRRALQWDRYKYF